MVYSLVASIPFSPVDIDIGHLARGEWNALTDRFRVWYMPGEDEKGGGQLCYVIIRKFDSRNGVLLYAHLMVNLKVETGRRSPSNFVLGILSNDDVRARSALNAMLEIPPAFHRRGELHLIEHRWRRDPDAVFRFSANIHSVVGGGNGGHSVYKMRFELPPGITEQFKRNMGAWWQTPN